MHWVTDADEILGNLCGDVKVSVRGKRPRPRKGLSEPILDKIRMEGAGLSQGNRRQSILA